MSTRHIRKTYPAMPFDISKSELSEELQAYFEAIHSYPDRFAKTRVSFQEHLLNILCAAHTQTHNHGSERVQSVS